MTGDALDAFPKFNVSPRGAGKVIDHQNYLVVLETDHFRVWQDAQSGKAYFISHK
jgi:hypothetical protein